MKTRETTIPRYAICIDNREYPASLELHKVYRVLPDQEAEQDGDMRIVDESGEDYLYPASFFMLLDLPQPSRLALTKTYAGWSQPS
ncbi:MAG TPA: hypothetical protein VL334_01870 [Anaerolineae bacterium]|nr:hypothetical protein [Anaerolineae bacterium]